MAARGPGAWSNLVSILSPNPITTIAATSSDVHA